MLSFLILTYNEEKNIKTCLESIKWSDDIVIIDSNSTDKTETVAKKTVPNLKLIKREFSDFADQRNFGLNEVKFKYDWVFHLDADEIFNTTLRDEIFKKISDTPLKAFHVPSKTFFLGKWLKYSTSLVYQVRLTRVQGFKFRQVGHGQKEDVPSFEVGSLKTPYNHYPFSKGIEEWIAKHNKYSTDEAKDIENFRKSFKIANFTSKDARKRRQSLKALSYYLPLRPTFRFIYTFIIQLGFLDGNRGFLYSSLISNYELMIELKSKELFINSQDS